MAGEGLSIALIDSGVDKNHPDLKHCDIETINLLDEQQKSDMKHGTAMAGVMCAIPNSDDGLIGIVPGISIFDIVVIDEDGYCSNELLANAITIATEKGVDIINISIGTATDSPAIKKAINEALSRDIIVVAATSNAGLEEVIYPSSYDGVIKVIPVDKDGQYLYGSIDPEKRDTYIKAPGKDIVTTMINKNKFYTPMDGTSISTAIASASIARVLYDYPTIDRTTVLNSLYAQDMITISTPF